MDPNNRRFWRRCKVFEERCFAAARIVKQLPPENRAPRQVVKMLEELKMELAGLTGNYDILAMTERRR